MAVPPPLPDGENNPTIQGSAESWDFFSVTEIQGATPGVVPDRFDYSDVVFPGRQRDFLRKAGSHKVYVIKSLDLIKVGIASDVPARLKAMTCDNPHGIEVIAAFGVPHAVAHWAEMYCHEKLLPFHHFGEWFRIDARTAIEVVRAVCTLAAASRGASLLEAKPTEGKWTVKRSGPPASLRLKPQMLDFIAHPELGGKPYEARRALARIRAKRAAPNNSQPCG